MRMNITDQQIIEIADNLDAGLNCYYNLKTGEIKTILNFDSWQGADEEPWEDDLYEIEENWSDYYLFDGMESRDSFRIMADFVETIDDQKLKNKLINALNRSKPFQNFKWVIDGSGEYRQFWFNYKKIRYIEWVKNQIEAQNSIEENE